MQITNIMLMDKIRVFLFLALSVLYHLFLLEKKMCEAWGEYGVCYEEINGG